jgi:hypothetical protein
MSRTKKAENNIMTEIIIKNEKILDFYNKNKHIDIEKVNLKFIEIIETIMSSSIDNPTVVNNILSALNSQHMELNNIQSIINHASELNKKELSNIKELYTSNISNIKSDIDNIKTTITSLNSNLTEKIYEIKEKYITEMKEQLNYKELNTLSNLSSVMDKLNMTLADKLSLIITETIPKTQNQQHNEIISLFKNDLLISLNNLNENDPNKLLKNITEIFDNKYKTMMSSMNETLLYNISQTENRLNTNLEQIKTISTTTSVNQETINDELLTFLNKYKSSSTKGSQSENMLNNILTKEYTTAEIIRKTNQTGQGDFILKRKDKSPILFENKEYNNNVNKDEVDKFIRDINNTEYHGIFISQHSGIVGKDNYQIDIHNKNILIYIHNCQYDITKINLALNAIDIIHDKLINITNNDLTISAELLKDINNEFQQLINTKEKILNNLKDYYKKTIENCNDITLPSLEKYMSNYFANLKKNTLICDICNQFETTSLKSLARHKTACKNKKKSSK